MRSGKEMIGPRPAIDVPVNNAGSIFDRRQETPDGLERTFAQNPMAWYLPVRLPLDPFAGRTTAVILPGFACLLCGPLAAPRFTGRTLGKQQKGERHGSPDRADRTFGRKRAAAALWRDRAHRLLPDR